MRKQLLGLLVIFLLLGACGMRQKEFTIKVSGTPGLKFRAQLGSATFGQGPGGGTVEGEVPAEYKIVCTVGGCTIQKLEGEEGDLKLEVWRGSKILTRQSTSDPEGVVIAAFQ